MSLVNIPDIHVGDNDKPMKLLKDWQKNFFVRGRMVYLNKNKEVCQFHEFIKGGLPIVGLDAGRGKLFQTTKDQIIDSNMPKVTAIEVTEENTTI